MVVVRIHFRIFLSKIVEEEHEDEQEVHKDHKRVNVLILHDDANEQDNQVKNA